MGELLSSEEIKWLQELDTLLSRAPQTLANKVSAYTTGDCYITMFDKVKVDNYTDSLGFDELSNDERCTQVEKSGSDTRRFSFPFLIESTAG